jgi:hypothetical protein
LKINDKKQKRKEKCLVQRVKLVGIRLNVLRFEATNTLDTTECY